jgi:hypothetical protein
MMVLLRRLWNTWVPIGEVIGNWIARIALTIFYLTIFLPYGIGVRLLQDPLVLKKPSHAAWIERTTNDKTLNDARRLS